MKPRRIKRYMAPSPARRRVQSRERLATYRELFDGENGMLSLSKHMAFGGWAFSSWWGSIAALDHHIDWSFVAAYLGACFGYSGYRYTMALKQTRQPAAGVAPGAVAADDIPHPNRPDDPDHP